MTANARRSNGHARTKLRNSVKAMGLPCAICGRPIDYSLKAGDPWSYELDEIHPVSRWQEFGYASKQAAALDPANVQPTHRICNQRKGANLHGEIRKKLESGEIATPLKASADW